MKFTPKTEQEVQKEGLLPEGTYNFEVLEASNARSKTGNDMIKLKLAIYPEDPSANPRFVFDYLLVALLYKIKHFCDVTGLSSVYESGSLTAEDCAGKTGFCKIGIKIDASGTYPPSNTVKDYVSECFEEDENTATVKTPSPKPEMASDDIVF